MKGFMVRTLLLLSGAMSCLIGVAVLFQPRAFFAVNGATLISEPGLMSEVRSPGGFLIVSGVIILLGAARANVSWLALVLSALVYGTFGISRLVSMIFDGMPPTPLVAATCVELVIGIVSLAMLVTE